MDVPVRYSFLIPVKEINAFVKESVPRILQIEREDYEIILLPDVEDESYRPARTLQLPTGPVGPAEKRDIGARRASGAFLVFLDDDAYPAADFLKILDQSFRNPAVVAVGGPAVTPPEDNFRRRLSGAVFLSRVAGGFPERYWPTGPERFVDDWPSVNLTVRREAFEAAGGFDSAYWPGEDTKFCLELVRKTGGKILYNPRLVVYHHRREGFLLHLRQVGRYGLHRGYFARTLPETSRRWYYFLPSCLFLALILSPAAMLFVPLRPLVGAGAVLYAAALLKAMTDILDKEKNVRLAACALPYILGTHLVYGVRFLQGFLFVRELRSRLRK